MTGGSALCRRQKCRAAFPRSCPDQPLGWHRRSRDLMTVTQTSDAASGAKLLVLLLAFAWGFNWIGAAVALKEVPPWSLRFVGTGIGAITLVLATWLSGRSLKVPP